MHRYFEFVEIDGELYIKSKVTGELSKIKITKDYPFGMGEHGEERDETDS